MSNSRKNWTFFALAAVFAVLQASDADAIRYQPRPNWTVGVGFGVGQGEFENVPGTFFYETDGKTSHYRNGVSPVIHIGRMLGEHFQIGVSYEAWLTEFGSLTSNPSEPDKWRRTMQNLSVAFAVFPGNQRGASGGVFLRVGAGLGWVGTGAKDVLEDEAQDEGEREDDWGWAMFGEGGYEFWVHSHATAGLSATFNYLDVSGDHFVTKAWFASIVMNFNVYW
jgi:hypothetical protein